MRYRRCLCTILIAVVASATVSSAKYETVTTGPYRVSFHLNTTEQYVVNVERPSTGYLDFGGPEAIGFIEYPIRLNNDSQVERACISVTLYSDSLDKSASKSMSWLRKAVRSYHEADLVHQCLNCRIDGQEGVLLNSTSRIDKLDSRFVVSEKLRIAALNQSKRVDAKYWPAFNVSGDTSVYIKSYYPWEDGTLSLLKTLHVEMVGNPPPVKNVVACPKCQG